MILDHCHPRESGDPDLVRISLIRFFGGWFTTLLAALLRLFLRRGSRDSCLSETAIAAMAYQRRNDEERWNILILCGIFPKTNSEMQKLFGKQL
jgi:hypothetical protein